MKINSLELQNFKFHKKLHLTIESQNCIVYGENGTGKSSIYWSLVSVFKKNLVNISDFKNRDMSTTDELKVVIKLDNDEELNLEETTILVEDNRKTIFFAHQDMLEEFLVYSDNFFDILDNKIKKYFTKINDFFKKLDKFNDEVDENNHEEKVPLRVKLTEGYEEFLNELLVKTNDIIKNHFDEKFIINFDYNWGLLDLSKKDYTFISPRIILQIENQSKLKLHLNEAKLKLVSIALFFALIKLEENEENSLKLLVLDDFLTSLDMSNRKLIVQYILENFGDYQKIILTHNIQFYNLIVRLLEMREEKDVWAIKHLFLMDIDNEEVSIVTTRNNNYRDEAKKELLNGEFHKSGNALRKEFERIVNEFRELLEIGKSEQLNSIIGILKSDNNSFYKKPFLLLEKLHIRYQNINTIIESSENEQAKIGKISYEIKEIKLTLQTEKCELSNLKNLLKKTEFYKNILFNPASHNNEEIEVYRKECINSLKLLEELNGILNHLK